MPVALAGQVEVRLLGHDERFARQIGLHRLVREIPIDREAFVGRLFDEESEPTSLGIDGHVSVVQWSRDGEQLALTVAPTALVDDFYMLQDIWIVDALRRTPHPTHAHLERALEWIDRVKPKRAILTNMHIDLDYETLAAETPAHVDPAYDGLRLTVAD